MSLNKTKPNLDGFQTHYMAWKNPGKNWHSFRDGEQLRATWGWEGSDKGYCPLGTKEDWHSCAKESRLGEGAVVKYGS